MSQARSSQASGKDHEDSCREIQAHLSELSPMPSIKIDGAAANEANKPLISRLVASAGKMKRRLDANLPYAIRIAGTD